VENGGSGNWMHGLFIDESTLVFGQYNRIKHAINSGSSVITYLRVSKVQLTLESGSVNPVPSTCESFWVRC
jgi:hypothetical protein